MPVKYVNRSEKTFYLHVGKTKTGKNKYFFSLKKDGTLAEDIPDGYEIYENPNAQVFLRRKLPRVITDEEEAVVNMGVKKYSKVEKHKIDIRKETITIYIVDQNIDELKVLLQKYISKKKEEIEKSVERMISFSPRLRFKLVNEENRLFAPERFCFFDDIDDWIEIGETDSLENLVKKFVKHLGQESFYELY